MAVSSVTQICNLALAHLGEASIAALDEDSTAGRACALQYAPTLEEVLRSHRWNFATARATLSRLEDDPPFGWSVQWQLPADCLRVLELNGSDGGDVVSEPWTIEGDKLLTHATTANVVYVRRITDVSLFDSLFVRALALKLAAVLAETIRGNTSKTAALLEEYGRLTAPQARRVDANEGRRRKGLLPLNSLAIRARGCGA